MRRILKLLVGGVFFFANTLAFSQSEAPVLGQWETPAPHIPQGTRNQDPSQGKLKGQTLRIKRPLVMVTDLQRSVKFYEGVIGLELYAVEPTYNSDPNAPGNQLFNLPARTRWRVATLNTSDQTRGITLREIPDVDFQVPQNPRLSVVLFEASEILAIYDRAIKAGATVMRPMMGSIPAAGGAPELRFLEFALLDPDGHAVAFFKYVDDDDEWEKMKKTFEVFDDFG